MTAAIVVSLLAIGGSFLAVGTPMRDSLQFPTRGGLKRPQPPRLAGLEGKFPDIKLHGHCYLLVAAATSLILERVNGSEFLFLPAAKMRFFCVFASKFVTQKVR